MIASDIDGVLCDTGDLAVEYARVEMGLTKEELLPYSGDYERGLVARFPVALREEANALIRAAFDENAGQVFDLPSVRDGAVEALTALKECGRFAGYVTRRQPDPRVTDATCSWLERHGFPDAPVHFTPWGVNKAVFLAELEADVIVEDSPTEISRVQSAGRSVIVMDHPYNRDLEGVHARVSCWRGFTSLLPLLARAEV